MKQTDQPWKEAAIGRFQNGDTIRTDQQRFTEYTSAKGDLVARMLYDHRVDPEEDVNISERPESQDQVKRLSERLHEAMGKDGLLERQPQGR